MGKGKGRGGHRAAARHSALLTVFGLGVAVQPFVGTPTGFTQNALTFFQQGNWAGGVSAVSANVIQSWAFYLFALVPLIVIAVIVKKLGSRLRITKHWTV